VIVAVPAVLIVQVTGDEVVGVASVRNGLVAARRAVFVVRVVARAVVPALTVLRIRARDSKHVFVDVRFVHVMQVPVVEIVDVRFVQYGGVSASGCVRMPVLIVRLVVCHRVPHFGRECAAEVALGRATNRDVDTP